VTLIFYFHVLKGFIAKVFTAATIYYFVFLMLPGYQPNFFYVCVGKFPAGHSHAEAKENRVLGLIVLISFLLHILVGVRYLHFRYLENRSFPPTVSQNTMIYCNFMNKISMTNFRTNFLGIAMLLTLAAIALRVASVDKTKLERFKEYKWIFAYAMYNPILAQCFSILLIVKRNATFRQYLKQELSNTSVCSNVAEMTRRCKACFNMQ
jgi:hypothetical protein